MGVWVNAGAGVAWNPSRGAANSTRGFAYHGRGGLVIRDRFRLGVQLARW